ncbi:Na(+)/H(+) antiporter subunit D [Candidatus Zixiibacteriota bacterium]
MIEFLPPGTLLILGALLFIFLKGRAATVALLVLPVLSFLHLLSFDSGYLMQFSLFGYELTPIRIDKLSMVWGVIFHGAAFLCALYSIHVKDRVQHISGLMYVGSAIGAVFAGDLITLFVYWELTAATSVFLIWASGTERAYKSGMRYLIIQVLSGVLLLAGVIIRVSNGFGLEFGLITDTFNWSDTGSLLILFSFGIKAAFPLLHMWLGDAYPEATVTGTLFLSIFTTKLAIYALARGFAGLDILIWIGAIMAMFPIFFAVIENDLRRVLAYSLNNQLGFMVVGIGIGTGLALNGAAAHAFANILFEGLLFMAMGAVLFRVGTIKGSELGGLYRTMPLTTVFCCVGAASISAFPLFSGFVTKSLIMTAVAEQHATVIWLMLLFASAGVFHHAGIKIPFFAFFAHDSGLRPKEAPKNMLITMGITAGLCLFIGIFPKPLYSLLPFPVDYVPYTTAHVINQLQLLILSAAAFTFLKVTHIYPPELKSTNLDFDWTYRRALPAVLRVVTHVVTSAHQAFIGMATGGLKVISGGVFKLHGPDGVFARTWSTGAIVVWVVIGLGAYLLLYFF